MGKANNDLQVAMGKSELPTYSQRGNKHVLDLNITEIALVKGSWIIMMC